LKLIVGLGNPGRQYVKTRHNIGYMTVDELARRHGVALDRDRFQGRFEKCVIRGVEVALLEPTTFMNLSGRSAAEAARFFKVEPADVLLIADDINLDLGALRMRSEGSAGGHNGIDDCIRMLGTDALPRLRVGVGPFTGRDSAGFVLGVFGGDEWKVIEPAIGRAADAAECWLVSGIEAAANRFNGTAPERRKPKPEKPKAEKPKPEKPQLELKQKSEQAGQPETGNPKPDTRNGTGEEKNATSL